MSTIHWHNVQQKNKYKSYVRNFFLRKIPLENDTINISFIKHMHSVHNIISSLFIKDIASIIIPYTNAKITVKCRFTRSEVYDYGYGRYFSYTKQSSIIFTFIDSHNFLLDTYGIIDIIWYVFKPKDINFEIPFDALECCSDDNIQCSETIDFISLYHHYSKQYYKEHSFPMTRLPNCWFENNSLRWCYYGKCYPISILNHKLFKNIMIIMHMLMKTALKVMSL